MSDKLSANVAAMKTNTDDLVAAFYEAIERLKLGNPRFTKKEREMWMRFLTNTIADVSALFWLFQSSDELRLKNREIIKLAGKSHRLGEQAKGQLIEVMRQTREMILDSRTKEAIALLTKIIDYYDNLPQQPPEGEELD